MITSELTSVKVIKKYSNAFLFKEKAYFFTIVVTLIVTTMVAIKYVQKVKAYFKCICSWFTAIERRQST